jgi:hypothetical protein
MTAEIEAARLTLLKAGFYVIPREAVKTMGAQHPCANRDLIRYGDRPDFRRSIHERIYFSLASEMLKNPGWVTISARDDTSQPEVTTFEARMKLIPEKWATDPFIEMVRRTNCARSHKPPLKRRKH